MANYTVLTQQTIKGSDYIKVISGILDISKLKTTHDVTIKTIHIKYAAKRTY